MARTVILKLLLVFLLLVTPNHTVATASDAKSFTFGLMGDMPYSEDEEQSVEEMLERMNREPLEFVVHVGDFKSGHSICSDEIFLSRLRIFSHSRHPLIYTPGDNDWTDCHRWTNGRYDPSERLNKLREIFYLGDRSLGQHKLTLQRQSMDQRYVRYRENARWQMNGVLFVTVNVPGSNNNFSRSAENNAEYHDRSTANKQWLEEAFQKTRQHDMLGLAIFFQANPGFKNIMSLRNTNGYSELLRQLADETQALQKPVLVAHGDTHNFRVDHPLKDPQTGKAIPNLVRVETFGSPSVNWVKITVDTADPKLFRIQPGK